MRTEIPIPTLCVVPDDRGLATWSCPSRVKIVTDAVLLKLYYFTMFDSYGENLARSREDSGVVPGKWLISLPAMKPLSMWYAELVGIIYDRPNVGDNLRSQINAYQGGVSSKSLPDMTGVHIYISGRTQSNSRLAEAYVFGFIEEGRTRRDRASEGFLGSGYAVCLMMIITVSTRQRTKSQ